MKEILSDINLVFNQKQKESYQKAYIPFCALLQNSYIASFVLSECEEGERWRRSHACDYVRHQVAGITTAVTYISNIFLDVSTQHFF